MYTIICSNYGEGQIQIKKNRKEVRNECERLKNIFSSKLVTNYILIEVMNDETGEIREFWNNRQNATLF